MLSPAVLASGIGRYMRERFAREKPLSDEEISRLKAYDLLDAIADFLSICAVVAIWGFFSESRWRDPEIYGLCAAMGVISVCWHALVPSRFLGGTKLLLNNLLSATFVTLIIRATGYEQSPFFFLYYLVLIGTALEIGVKAALFMSLIVTVAYVVTINSSPTASGIDLARSLSFWANIASVWVVGWVAALSAHEAEKVRKAIEQAKDRIEAFSKTDWLTGVYNRRHLDALASQEISRAERYQRPLSLLIIDSDHLKAVNDAMGHQAGDQLLVDIARIISQRCRVSDTVIRYGGDEFVVLLPETDSMGAGFLGERIRRAIEQHALDVPNDQHMRTTVSVGVASFPTDAADARELLANADSALYRSKQAGRNRTTTYSGELLLEPPDEFEAAELLPRARGAPPEGGQQTA